MLLECRLELWAEAMPAIVVQFPAHLETCAGDYQIAGQQRVRRATSRSTRAKHKSFKRACEKGCSRAFKRAYNAIKIPSLPQLAAAANASDTWAHFQLYPKKGYRPGLAAMQYIRQYQRDHRMLELRGYLST